MDQLQKECFTRGLLMFAIGLGGYEMVRNELEKVGSTIPIANESKNVEILSPMTTNSIIPDVIVQKVVSSIGPTTKITSIDATEVGKRRNTAAPDHVRCKEKISNGKKQCSFQRCEGSEYCTKHTQKRQTNSDNGSEDQEETE